MSFLLVARLQQIVTSKDIFMAKTTSNVDFQLDPSLKLAYWDRYGKYARERNGPKL